MSWSTIMYSLSYTSRHRASQRIANHIRSRFCLQLHRKGNVQMPSVHWSFKIRINPVQLAAAMCSLSKSKCQQQVRFHAMSPQRLWVHSQSHVTAVNIRCTGRRNYSVQFSPANPADVNVLSANEQHQVDSRKTFDTCPPQNPLQMNKWTSFPAHQPCHGSLEEPPGLQDTCHAARKQTCLVQICHRWQGMAWHGRSGHLNTV